MTYILTVLMFLSACSLLKGKGNERKEGHTHLYSMPDEPKMQKLEPHERRIMVVATNDGLGGEMQTRKTSDGGIVTTGGLELQTRYWKILREQYPHEVLAVDAGGSLTEAGLNPWRAHEDMVVLGYDAVTLSTDDLRTRGAWAPKGWSRIPPSLVLSNVFDLHTTQPITWGPNTSQYLKSINGTKVGVIGVISDKAPLRLDPSSLNGLYVEPTMQAVLKQSRALRLKGAETVVLLFHGGLRCGVELSSKLGLPISKVNFDPQNADVCNGGELANFLQDLPSGTVDLIVTGGFPNKAANIINGVPVIQTLNGKNSFSWVELVTDTATHKIVPEKTVIHQPIIMCRNFFKATEDCYAEDKSVDHRQVIPARFLGKDI